MNIFAFALVAFVAGANASPQPQLQVKEAIRSGEPRLVTNQIEKAIKEASQAIVDAGLDPFVLDHQSTEYALPVPSNRIEKAIKEASQAIVDAGLDPFVLDHQSTEYALPVPSLFNYRSSVTDVLFRGASDISINSLSFGLTLMRLQYDISLPEILVKIGASELDFNLFGKNFNLRLSGSFVVKNIQTTGTIRFNTGIITGTTIRSIDLRCKLSKIESRMNLKLLGRDLSNAFNKYFEETLHETLKEFEGEINEMLTIVGKSAIESML